YKSNAFRAFLRCEVRHRPCFVHRHRWLLEVAHQRAKPTATDVKRDRARNRTVPPGPSATEAIAVTYRRWRRACFSHKPRSAGSVRTGNQQSTQESSRTAGAHGNSQRPG